MRFKVFCTAAVIGNSDGKTVKYRKIFIEGKNREEKFIERIIPNNKKKEFFFFLKKISKVFFVFYY